MKPAKNMYLAAEPENEHRRVPAMRGKVASPGVTEKIQEIEAEVVRRMEMEQQRVGQDLHDDVCQVLTGLKYRSALLAKKIRAGEHEAAFAEAVKLEGELGQTILSCRELARQFNPACLESKGLVVGLLELASSIEACGGARCRCQFSTDTLILDRSVIRNLYRIAQEAVQNAFKHGEARNIAITLENSKSSLCLTVADDGAGLHPDHETKSGHGLRNIRARATSIGASVEISNGSPSGVVVQVRLQFAGGCQP